MLIDASEDIDSMLADYIFGDTSGSIYFASGKTSMRVWSNHSTKLVIDRSGPCNSRPVRLYFKLDPVFGLDISVPRSALMKRLSSLCSDDVGYNFANYQFDIKGKSVAGVVNKAISIRDKSLGMPNPVQSLDNLKNILDFKNDVVIGVVCDTLDIHSSLSIFDEIV